MGRGRASRVRSRRSNRRFWISCWATYVAEGIEELDVSKLSQLETLRNGSVSDGVLDLGAHSEIRELFIGFQRFLYQPPA